MASMGEQTGEGHDGRPIEGPETSGLDVTRYGRSK